jgi:hypothetical protein
MRNVLWWCDATQVLHSAFTVTQFTVGQTVQPNATLNPVVLRFEAALAQEELFSTELVLATNGFSYSIPLHVYHGKLHYQLDDRFLWHKQPNITVTVDAEGNLLPPPPPKDRLGHQVTVPHPLGCLVLQTLTSAWGLRGGWSEACGGFHPPGGPWRTRSSRGWLLHVPSDVCWSMSVPSSRGVCWH